MAGVEALLLEHLLDETDTPGRCDVGAALAAPGHFPGTFLVGLGERQTLDESVKTYNQMARV